MTGPLADISVEPEYLDPETEWTLPVPTGHTVFEYLFEGGEHSARWQRQ